ncbi:MAG: 3-hydroxybutyryl-CoA dehydrogenase [Alphaproteobacteria bacterium]
MIQAIGVIGAGQMGAGIAQVCAMAGYRVVLQDISAEQLESAKISIQNGFLKLVSKGKLSEEDKESVLAELATSTDVAALSDCDLIIEAATESEQLKQKIFEGLVPHLKAGCIIATNTSSLSITRLASFTQHPQQFIGMHFMNPVPVMQLVEVIRGLATDDKTYQAVLDVVSRLGKQAATSQDIPGFIVNRILIPMINEAIFVLHEGVGDRESIDKAMTLGAGLPMGPLALADMIGLDTCLAIMHVLYDDFGDSKYRPCPLLSQYVAAGWLGRKSGRGFYEYNPTPAPVNVVKE